MSEVVRHTSAQSAPAFLIPNRDDVVRTPHNGTAAREVISADYDVTGGDSGSIGAHGTGVYVPDNAIITKAWIDVITTFTSATDAATIAVKVEAANDLVSAIAISNVSNVWDAGLKGTLVGTPALDGNARTAIAGAAAEAASLIKTTAAREITFTNAVEALTGGKARIFVEYVISE